MILDLTANFMLVREAKIRSLMVWTLVFDDLVGLVFEQGHFTDEPSCLSETYWIESEMVRHTELSIDDPNQRFRCEHRYRGGIRRTVQIRIHREHLEVSMVVERMLYPVFKIPLAPNPKKDPLGSIWDLLKE